MARNEFPISKISNFCGKTADLNCSRESSGKGPCAFRARPFLFHFLQRFSKIPRGRLFGDVACL